jgi:hypothetical protein
LLNRIAINNGGPPVRPGICGDALYSAIVQFEGKHLGGQRNGYVDPGGAMLKLLLLSDAAVSLSILTCVRKQVNRAIRISLRKQAIIESDGKPV